MKLKKLVFEGLGTFLLTFAVGMSSQMIQSEKVKDLSFIKALSFFMVYMFFYPFGRNISGCHLNPIISFSMFMVKKINAVDMVAYIFTQFITAILSCLFLKTFLEENDEAPLEVSLSFI